MNIEITVRVVKSICKKCKKDNEEYYLSDFAYGERLLLTKDGKDYAYLNCFEDKSFKELEEIIKKIRRKDKLKEEKKTEYFNKIFGITCDKVNNKELDAFYLEKKCNFCGSIELETKIPEEEVYKKVTMTIVSHNDWNKLSDIEKMEQIETKLKEIILK